MRWSVLTLLALVGATPALCVARDCVGDTLPTSAQLAAPGPHAVGVRTVVLVDGSRPTAPNGTFPGAPDRTFLTEVWYPAVQAGRDVPLDGSAAPYPVVVHSHALLDSRIGERYV